MPHYVLWLRVNGTCYVGYAEHTEIARQQSAQQMCFALGYGPPLRIHVQFERIECVYADFEIVIGVDRFDPRRVYTF